MHSLITIALPFEGKYTEAVNAALDRLGNPLTGGPANALDTAAFVHFMSATAWPSEDKSKANLVIEFSADGEATDAVKQLAKAIGSTIDELLRVADVDRGKLPLSSFLIRHRVAIGQGWGATPGLNFDGTPGMTVTRIRDEAKLAATVTRLIEQHPPADRALQTLQRVRTVLWSASEWKWAFDAEPASILSDEPKGAGSTNRTLADVLRALPALAASLFATFLWPFLAIAAALALGVGVFFFALRIGVWTFVGVIALELIIAKHIYSRFRQQEMTDHADDIAPNAECVDEIMKRENFAAHNHLAAASTMKPGKLRRFTLRLGLWAAGQLAIHFSRPSFLADTGVIHFARWVLLPGTDTLLFFSNYDGAWESYLEDFIQKATQGVTGIWSNTQGFPRTEYLFGGGAADGNRLRRWTRRQQSPTRLWYTAYPDLTLARIRLNAAIRQGVASARTEADASDWLSCIGSAPRPPTQIETREIPTLVFGGLRRLSHARAIFVEFLGDRTEIKKWLRHIEPRLSYGDNYGKHSGVSSALFVGLAESMLRKLGLEEALSTFSVAYQDGSAKPWRARALGDVGINEPNAWRWGGPNSAVDAVLLFYDRDPQDLTRRIEHALQDFPHRVQLELILNPTPQNDDPIREPFGFVDGISDPVIRGTGNWTLEKHRNHVVEPGEFILAYPDNSGMLACSPVVASKDDPQGLLPSVGQDPFRQRPEFAVPQPFEQHDLGCNGTYLVIRQLEQDVEAFEEECQRVAAEVRAKLGRRPNGINVHLAEWVAAKMVGRWRNGEPLVRFPYGPSTSSPNLANEFIFKEDPDGTHCPFGAHIRRANPRDTFDPGSEIQLKITNRHRILRVGRSYSPQGDLEKPGLLFMCLNADIERQFEFVQQTWILGRNFNGLENEVDAVLGREGVPHCLTVPTPVGPVRLLAVKNFVKVLGSGYFFLPSKRAMAFFVQ